MMNVVSYRLAMASASAGIGISLQRLFSEAVVDPYGEKMPL